jgi:hypothetical protein
LEKTIPACLEIIVSFYVQPEATAVFPTGKDLRPHKGFSEYDISVMIRAIEKNATVTNRQSIGNDIGVMLTRH